MLDESATPPRTAHPTAVLVVAHGSRAETANRAHEELVQAARLLLPDLTVRMAFLELAEPSIPTAIADAVGAGYREIRLLPYFLHPGKHTSRDLPDAAREAMAAHPGTNVTVAPLFGADPALVDLLVRQLRAVDHPG